MQNQDAKLLEDASLLLRDRSFDVNDLTELPTPVILVEEIVLNRNIERMAAYCREHKIALRPHSKTHKSLEIAQRQLAAGAIGLTVAKPAEAQVFAATGASLLIGYPPVTLSSLAVIDELRQTTDVTVALDSVEAIERLETIAFSGAPKVGVLVDVDLGMKRTGVGTPEESRQLAERISASASLRLDGLFCYPGHIDEPPSEQAAELTRANETILRHLECWARAGFSANIVSGGSTPTAYNSHVMSAVTEIRPGTYVFNDSNTLRGGHCQLADCAARVITTVVSTAVADRVVVDAGSKALARDQCLSEPAKGYGFVLEYPQARVRSLNEEHGVLDVSACSRAPRIGERISIIPNHICPAVNLTDAIWLRTVDGSLKQLAVDARGRVW